MTANRAPVREAATSDDDPGLLIIHDPEPRRVLHIGLTSALLTLALSGVTSRHVEDDFHAVLGGPTNPRALDMPPPRKRYRHEQPPRKPGGHVGSLAPVEMPDWYLALRDRSPK